MKVLFIGGTGIISSACSKLAIEKGIDLYLLNRGKSCSIRDINGATQIIADIRNYTETREAIKRFSFDVVVDWVAFEPAHIDSDIELFRDKTDQFVFISSASAYQTPPQILPVTEKTPLCNPLWKYSQNKISCEQRLMEAYSKNGFPFTIVRPSHTYDKTLLPIEGGYTVVARMLRGKKIVIHGDGTSIWTLTHHEDFAKGFIGLLGKNEAIGEAFHITSDEWLTWNQIHLMIAEAFGTEAKIVHVPSSIIARYHKQIGDSLQGDKMHSMIFDNSKLKQLVPEFKATIPFSTGIKQIVSWYNANESFRIVDKNLDEIFDRIINDYK
jgi:nucleoside-diphosphate-sugar epimerase